MTEGNDFQDDSFLAKYMSEHRPTENPGDGFYVVDKKQGTHFHPVTRVRDQDIDQVLTQADQSGDLLDGNVHTLDVATLTGDIDASEEDAPGIDQPILEDENTLENTGETQEQKEQLARRSFAEKFISPIRSFLTDTAIEAGDALARIKEAATSMSYSSDIWDVYVAQSEGKPIEQIGGIPLPKEYPTITKKADEFIIAGHTGFGERALPSYDHSQEGLQKVANTLTALERGVQAGANLLEIDLAFSSDGEILVYHKLPGQKDKQMTAAEFLNRSPESLTLTESITWLLAQPESIQLFLELKSDIPVATVIEHIKRAIPQKFDETSGQMVEDNEKIEQTLKRLCIYAYKGSDMIRNKSGKEILRQKQELGLPIDQLKVFYITNGILTKEAVAKILDENEGIYAFEQGMMPWGLVGESVPSLLRKVVGLMSKSSIEEMVDYVHSRGVKIITGTANDPAAIHELVKMGFDGLVPDNPVDLEMAGIKIESFKPQPKVNEFIPPSTKERVDQANLSANERRAQEEQRRQERASRWQNRRQTVKSLIARLGVPTAAA